MPDEQARTAAVDPITLSVVFHRLLAVNKEMGITMARTSRSSIFAEVHDFSCAICDWVPRIIAQVDGVPSHTASSMLAAKAIMDYFAGDVKPGDIFLINDAYTGGTHLADVTVVKPIFYGDQLLFVAVNRAHHMDIGGLSPGSYSPLATEIYHEGIRIPPLRIYRGDEPIRDVLDTLCLNTRMPDMFLSDIRAQAASCRVAERRLVEMADRYGVERLKQILQAIHEYAEQCMRQEIVRIPDGVYVGESYLDDDGFDRRQVKVRVQLTVKGDEMWVDFEGTDPQTTGFINSPFANSCTSVYVGVLTTVSQDVPHNEGAYQPIHITAPKGTVVNPLPPAPVASCTLDTACAILEAMYIALSQAIPDRTPAGWNRWNGATLAGVNPASNRFYVQYTFCGMGGAGALSFEDGLSFAGDGIDLGGLSAPNIESNEVEFPNLTDFHEFDPDSGGAGQYRGGLGVRYRIHIEGDPITLVMSGDGQVNPPYGLFGGRPGSVNRLVLDEGTPGEKKLPSKGVLDIRNRPPEVGPVSYTVYSSGGGGWGSPLKRPLEKVAWDVKNGYVSREKAATQYGVVLGADLTVDVAATETLRQTTEGENR